MKGEHLIQCCGAKVAIRGRKVEVLNEPRIHSCPLHESLYGFKVMNKEAVKKTVEFKMRNYGFCCQHRVFDEATVVSYGASEIMKTCIEMKLLDCAVTVCEGAGTVIASNPSLAQGIGAHLTGIIKTSPIRQIIRRIRAQGGSALDPRTAQIDQAKGFQKAVEMGFNRIAVTVAGFQAKQIIKIRLLERNSNARATIFSICNTCTAEKDMKHVVNADIVTASASRVIRKQIGPKALMQLGVTIPVFALTERGKEIMLAYLSKFDQKIVVFRAHLPYVVEKKGPTIRPRWERKTKTIRTRQNSSPA
jgi:putative methanogenesis marker protein 8